jgi:iron complex transport system ATP-binding protein
MISVENLIFSYEENFTLKIDLLSFEEKLLHVIIGPNGSGKSTLGKIISGMLNNYKGNIKINNKNISEFTENELSKHITYMNKRLIRNYNVTVFDFVSFGRFPHKKNIFFDLEESEKNLIKENLIKVDLLHKTNNLLYELSDGEIQRAYLAKILCQETKYAVLDEPTANLDIAHIKIFLNLLKSLKEKTTFIVILHSINEALEIFDKLTAFDNGKINFVWTSLKDFDLQKLINLYKVNLNCISNNGRYVVYL